MFSRKNRLSSRKDFSRLMKRGRYVPASELTLKFVPNGTKATRFGIVVSTKVSKNSVDRNKLRRRLREILRLNLDSIAPGFDVVIITNARALKLEYAQLRTLLVKMLEYAKLFKKEV